MQPTTSTAPGRANSRARPPTFTAIDFETANCDPDSACAVGLVRVEEGHVVRRECRLIRPWTQRFEFTYLHGIGWADVAGAPTFAGVWPVIDEMCRGVEFVAAHNAEFDEGVLRACCTRAGIRAKGLRFECTVKMARRSLGIYPTGLAVVAKRLGIPLDHHNAASDAEACAQIVLSAHGAMQDRGGAGSMRGCVRSPRAVAGAE
jgi:DNA polymerase-3 subunit epsilon